jgi:hypothetical protein
MAWNMAHYDQFRDNLARYQGKPETKEKRRPKQAMYQRRHREKLRQADRKEASAI